MKRNIINIVISFCLVLLLGLCIASYFLINTVLDQKYIMKKMKKVEFYEETSRTIRSDFENYEYQSGLPVEIFDNIIDEELIKNDVNSVVDFIYKGKGIQNSHEQVRENLTERINIYLAQNNIETNSNGNNNIEKFKDLIEKEYEDNIHIDIDYLTTLHKLVTKPETIINFAYVMSIIFSVVLVIVLLIVNKNDLADGIAYFGVSVLVTGIIGRLLIMLINTNVDIENVLIFSMALSKLFHIVAIDIIVRATDLCNKLMFSGATIIIAFAFVLTIPERLIRRKYNTKLTRRRQRR